MNVRLMACLVDTVLIAAGGSALWVILWGKSWSDGLFFGAVFAALYFPYLLWRSRNQRYPMTGYRIVRFFTRRR